MSPSLQDGKRPATQPPHQQILVGVVGVTGSGKSDFIKRLTKCEEIVVGDDSESQTDEIQQYHLLHNGVTYVLVDTPGFDDSRRGSDDDDILRKLADWLVDTYCSQQRLNGLIYLLSVAENRQRGSENRNQNMIKNIVGEGNFGNVMLGLTFCDRVPADVIASRKKELMETERWWGGMVKRGAIVEEIPYGDRSACLTILERFAPRPKMTLQLQSEMVDQGKRLHETEAARAVAEGVAKLRAEFESKTADVRKSYALRRANATSHKEVLTQQLNQQYEQAINSRQEQETALRYDRKKHEETARQTSLRLEERQRDDAQERGMAAMKLQEEIRRTELEGEKLRKKEQDLIQHARKSREYYIKLTDSLNAVNEWGQNGVAHVNIEGHGMLERVCDRCLISPFPREGVYFSKMSLVA